MLKEKIESELRAALKQGDELKLSVLRMLSSAIHNKEIEKRTRSGSAEPAVLSDEETIAVIRAEIKRREDAASAFSQGGREGSAQREREEAKVLSGFLPPELSDEEIDRMVSQGMAAINVSSGKDFGKLMAWVMGRVGGRASGKRVAALVKSKLGP